MGGIRRKDKPPKKQGNPPVTPLPPVEPADDDQHEDGDFATPKRDRNGTDDEPL
jgi:hypothetical protein